MSTSFIDADKSFLADLLQESFKIWHSCHHWAKGEAGVRGDWRQCWQHRWSLETLATLEWQTKRDQQFEVCRANYCPGNWKKSEQYYLKEMNLVLRVGKFVQFGLVHLQLSNLLLDLLQQLLSLTDGRLFLGFHQLPHLKALHLDRANQFGKDGVALLGCCPSRALEGDPKQHIADLDSRLSQREKWCYKRMHHWILDFEGWPHGKFTTPEEVRCFPHLTGCWHLQWERKWLVSAPGPPFLVDEFSSESSASCHQAASEEKHIRCPSSAPIT